MRERGIEAKAPHEPKVAANRWQSQRARPQQPAQTSSLFAHRSIRMAHSMGFAVCLLSPFLLLFPWVTLTRILLLYFMVCAVWLARSGGAWLYSSVLPPMLQEGPAPMVHPVPDGGRVEQRVTYSARQSRMVLHLWQEKLHYYRNYPQNEPLTVSKIARITWAKVSEGTFRCDSNANAGGALGGARPVGTKRQVSTHSQPRPDCAHQQQSTAIA